MTIIAYHPGSLVKLAVAVVLFGAGTAHARNLIRNGGFEMPSTPAGTYTTYGPGQAIGAGWTVVGNGNVATVNAYNEGGVVWVAHKGSAFVDLTGTCDCGANSGVAQTVKTVDRYYLQPDVLGRQHLHSGPGPDQHGGCLCRHDLASGGEEYERPGFHQGSVEEIHHPICCDFVDDDCEFRQC